MQLTNVLAVLALAVASTKAIAIPNNLSEGVYQTYTDENGKVITEKLDTRLTTVGGTSSPSSPLKRSPDYYFCGCGFNMNPGNTDAAVADIKNQLNNIGFNGTPPGRSVYSIRGDGNQRVVAFLCNRDSANWAVLGNQFGGYLAEITGRCGRYIAGTYSNNNKYVAGYMRYGDGLDFCGASTTSPAHSC
ncbi:hypothetical protein AA313_de0206012 [Arthrobotrys entomopaga]|nr:hypothetical protein AA313_de0206012 [Arthrobotrys entomopaga]